MTERGEPAGHLAEAGDSRLLEKPLRETTECHLNTERKEVVTLISS